MTVKICVRLSLAVSLFILATISVADAQYSGGSGTADDPYQIATAADLIALGETPDDYDKHFILTADIDLDPNLPGGRVFDEAIIAPCSPEDTYPYVEGTPFTGVFDGHGCAISNLTITGESYLGLFGRLGYDAEVWNVGVVHVNITSPDGGGVGALAGENEGTVVHCQSSGSVHGAWAVGGLVEYNEHNITLCQSTGFVNGTHFVGGLVGRNQGAGSTISRCSANCIVQADSVGGGLVGSNTGNGTSMGSSFALVANCYSIVKRGSRIAGLLVGKNGRLNMPADDRGYISNGYASCEDPGPIEALGLVGDNVAGYVLNCFWDTQACGVVGNNEGGTPKTTAEMQTASTFLEAGWDFIGETVNGPNDIWKIVEGQTYPLLSWQKYGGGTGEPNDPYLIYTAEHLNALGAEPSDYDKHFKLMADIDLSEYSYDRAVIAPDCHGFMGGIVGMGFSGVFDGSSHKISHLTVLGQAAENIGDIGWYLGLFGKLERTAEVSNLGLEAVEISGGPAGGLVMANMGRITNCYSTGKVTNGGGLVGENWGSIRTSYSIATVIEGGGLVSRNRLEGSIANSYSAGTVSGSGSYIRIGGLVSTNGGNVVMSYSVSVVSGEGDVGGLVGFGWIGGRKDEIGSTSKSFWDMEKSGQVTSVGGLGLTTAEMQTANTFLEAGWDFIDETDNGTGDIWWIDEGQDYPRLWWEVIHEG